MNSQTFRHEDYHKVLVEETLNLDISLNHDAVCAGRVILGISFSQDLYLKLILMVLSFLG